MQPRYSRANRASSTNRAACSRVAKTYGCTCGSALGGAVTGRISVSTVTPVHVDTPAGKSDDDDDKNDGQSNNQDNNGNGNDVMSSRGKRGGS